MPASMCLCIVSHCRLNDNKLSLTYTPLPPTPHCLGHHLPHTHLTASPHRLSLLMATVDVLLTGPVWQQLSPWYPISCPHALVRTRICVRACVRAPVAMMRAP